MSSDADGHAGSGSLFCFFLSLGLLVYNLVQPRFGWEGLKELLLLTRLGIGVGLLGLVLGGIGAVRDPFHRGRRATFAALGLVAALGHLALWLLPAYGIEWWEWWW